MAKAVKDLKKMQKALERQKITIEDSGIEVTINGTMKIVSIKIDGVENKKLAEVLNKAIKKAQLQSIESARETGDLNKLLSSLV